MNKKIATIIGYIFLVIAGSVTAYLLLKIIFFNIDKGYKKGIVTGDLVMLLWLVSPYLVMGFNLGLHARKKAEKVGFDFIVIFLVSAAGLYLLISNIYFSRDAQAPIAMLFFPIYQLVGFLILNVIASIKSATYRKITK